MQVGKLWLRYVRVWVEANRNPSCLPLSPIETLLSIQSYYIENAAHEYRRLSPCPEINTLLESLATYSRELRPGGSRLLGQHLTTPRPSSPRCLLPIGSKRGREMAITSRHGLSRLSGACPRYATPPPLDAFRDLDDH